MLSQSVLYSGHEEPGLHPVDLTCGPLSFSFDPEWAWLRTIRVLGKEVVRAVYSAVRDQYWNTVKPRLSNLRIMTTEKAIEIDFDAHCREGVIDFTWKGRIRATSNGILVFEMDGHARTAFLKNRCGFCVLHPLECTGRACRLEKVDGAVEQTRFPYYVSPHQPFQDLRALSYEVLQNLTVETRFEGDIFETEDQRNWTDASYKTYCTPLSLPHPVLMNAGDEVRQSVTIRLLGQVPEVPIRSSSPTQPTVAPVGTTPLALPRLGLCLSSESAAESETALKRLRQLNLAHVRLDLFLDRDGWEDMLANGATQAENLGTHLELAVHVSEDPEARLSELSSQLRSLRPRLSACLVFGRDRTTPPDLIRQAQRLLAGVLRGIPLGAGSNVYFTELNRNRPQEMPDLACYPITPQVHAFDDESVLQTPPVQPWTVQTARTFLGSIPLAVTPITLKPRVNPNVGKNNVEAVGAIPTSVDFRQVSLFGAVWTLASFKYLAESGAASVTYYETLGWKGVMETEQGNRAPFPSIPGSVYPLYHVLADIGEYRDGGVVSTLSTARPGVDALLLVTGERRRLIVGNSTRSVQSVLVTGCGLDGFVRVKVLDETTAEEARCQPENYRQAPGILREVRNDRLTLALLPYAIVTVDSAEVKRE